MNNLLYNPTHPKRLSLNNTEIHFLPHNPAKLGLTLYSNSFRETSFYNGHYSKGGFNSPLGSSPKSTSFQPKHTKTLSMQPSFMNASTISTKINRSIDIDPEIIHEFPFKDEILSREPSKKLQKLLKPSISPERTLPKLQVITKKMPPSLNPSLNDYLDILQTSPGLKTATATLSVKLHGKHRNTEPEYEGIRGLIDKQLAEHKMTSNRPSEVTSILKVASPRRGIQPIESSQASMQSSLVLSTENIMTTTASPSRKKNNAPRSSIQSFCSVETNKEDLVARELAEELANSYKVYTVNAAKNKDIQIKVKNLLNSGGVLPLFQLGKPGRSQPLSIRIYQDLMGFPTEEELQAPQSPKQTTNKITLSLSPRMNLSRAHSKTFRLVPHKYKVYKMISQELTKINLDYKIQEVESLEGKLIQAKEEFDKRRDMVLYHVKKKDAGLFRVLKTHCDTTENAITMYTGCSETFLGERVNKDEKEISLVNKNLDGVMKNWRKYLGN